MISQLSSTTNPAMLPPAASSRRRNERGASLIEIMVVLVILLTGIFLVIRIFPIGFGTLRAHENRTNAVRLAEQLLGQVRTDAVNLPQGVLMGYLVDVGGGRQQMNVVTDHYPDKLDQFCGKNDQPGGDGEDTSPCTTPNQYFKDVNKFRVIRGEAVKIPLPTTITDASGNAVTGSAYTLRLGPAYMDPQAGNPANAPDLTLTDPAALAKELSYYNSYLAVNSAPLTRIVAESGGGANINLAGYLRSTQNYLIDYGDDDTTAMILFQPRAPLSPARKVPTRTFTLSYTYEANGGLTTVDKVTISVPDNASAIWQPIPLPTGASVMDVSPGSDVVTRSFSRLKVGDDWDKYDPYEYKLVSNNVSQSANIGVLNFNPAGANYSEVTAYGQQSFTAYLDYSVLDWHIIHEDREVPGSFLSSGGLIPVKTTLTFIKKFGDTDSDNTIYNGLYSDPALTNSDLQVFNLDDPTGTPLTRGDYNNQAATPNADYFIDDDPRGGSFRTGTIYVNTARQKAGAKLRILYKAEGDWAVSLEKAYDRYTVATQTNSSGVVTRLPYVPVGGYSTVGVSGTGANSQIRVPYSDLNKAFLVTLQYRTQGGAVKRLSPIQMVADGDSTLSPALEDTGGPQNGNDRHFAYIDVSKYLSKSVNKAGEFLDAVEWYPYNSIVGVSAKARVIYHDNNNTSNSWRIQDLDTFLTPAAQEDVK